MIMSRCTPIFLLMYIYFYIYDLANKQTKMFIMIQHTKKSEQPTQRKDAPICFMFIYYFERPSRPSEDDLDFFILVEVFDKVSVYIITGHTVWPVKEPAAGPLDLWHGPRICQKFINVEHVYIRQRRSHGTTIHTY